MKRALYSILILGFLVVDFFFFHDVFKAGEVTTLPQYLTGILSIPVFIVSIKALLENKETLKT